MKISNNDNAITLVKYNYKRVVKKIEHDDKLCEELSQMMNERAEIESLYAKKLKGNITPEFKQHLEEFFAQYKVQNFLFMNFVQTENFELFCLSFEISLIFILLSNSKDA